MQTSSCHSRVCLVEAGRRVVLALLIMAVPSVVQATESLEIRVTIDLSSDVGQPLGTVWEAVDKTGTPVAGAGFLAAYNTYHRSERREVHVYARMPGPKALTLEPLPRPSDASGIYLLSNGGALYADARGHGDGRLRRWQPDAQRWVVDPQATHRQVALAGDKLTATEQAIRFGERTVLELQPDEGVIADWYYTHGLLVIRRQRRPAPSATTAASTPVNELRGFSWTPAHGEPLIVGEGQSVALDPQREFVYAFGPDDDRLLAATNRGGVHRYDGQKWSTLRSPDGKSFQVYASLRVRDRLLLGQYPSGELFEIQRGALERLDGWPPVMEGVSSNAREAQTLALYGGDVYVGVWPWGEVWRRDLAQGRWQLCGRTFTHPALTDATTHPYEEETKAVGEVLNLWGQRVTSMVPLGDSLYLSTSSKGGQPFDERLAFLQGEKRKEYGAVYRYRLPGCLAALIEFAGKPTELRFRITPTTIEVWQDGVAVGRTAWKAPHRADLKNLRIRIGNGVYGPAGVPVTEVADAAGPSGSQAPDATP